MKTTMVWGLLSVWGCWFSFSVCGQDESGKGFEDAAQSIQTQLQASIEELNRLREQVADETVPLSRELNRLEAELLDVRLEFQQTARQLDSRTLDLSNLRAEIQSRNEESAYLSNLLSEYIRNFESRLHIAELQRYRDVIDSAQLASENSNLSQEEIYQAQAELLLTSVQRLNEALGGARFHGTAVDAEGMVKPGEFLLFGPVALFQSLDQQAVGIAEQRLGSLEPAVIPFGNPQDASAAMQLFAGTGGALPFDPTLGNAHKIEKTEETWLEHIQKGGPVMYPIFTLAAISLLVALWKWIGISLIPIPPNRKIQELLKEVRNRNQPAALHIAANIKGPIARMLKAGVEHLNEPRDLMEEVMFEEVLKTKLKLERFLPFIAISAAAAPLLGLLGTVTGIINTFKLITVFGSGDVKALSGGISEALITTEYGLIVAIPSLLIHAFLSRKARGVVNQMETAAVALVNQAGKSAVQNPSGYPNPISALQSEIPDPGMPAAERT